MRNSSSYSRSLPLRPRPARRFFFSSTSNDPVTFRALSGRVSAPHGTTERIEQICRVFYAQHVYFTFFFFCFNFHQEIQNLSETHVKRDRGDFLTKRRGVSSEKTAHSVGVLEHVEIKNYPTVTSRTAVLKRFS